MTNPAPFSTWGYLPDPPPLPPADWTFDPAVSREEAEAQLAEAVEALNALDKDAAEASP